MFLRSALCALRSALCALRSALTRGRARDAVGPLEAAMASPAAHPAQQALFRAASSFVHLNLGDPGRAMERADEAIAMAIPVGDAYTMSEAMHSKARVLASTGRAVAAAELSVEALRLLGGTAPHGGTQNLPGTTGLTLITIGRVDEGRQALADGLRLNESLGAAQGVALPRVILGETCFQLGEWDDAVENIESTIGMVGAGPAWPVPSYGCWR